MPPHKAAAPLSRRKRQPDPTAAQCNSDGGFILTKDFAEDIPHYAILSHTWGADTEEVTFKNLIDGTGKDKIGYDKIRFCGKQARLDGLRYIWVDTCCIDKSNSTELAEAINSMFRWYHDAVKCYVYLSDVSRNAFDADDRSSQLPWESAFQESRWFTRGWTLQELIAPTSVEFFSKDWEQLGNKSSLERHICKMTGIPVKALRGSLLSDFSAAERMAWAENRKTTRKEDKAYSLLGIFNVHMPLIYGEGREKALKRLQEEIDKASKGIKHEDFSVVFSLSNVSDIEHFVAREKELVNIHKILSGNDSRRIAVLQGLGGIGKTQLSIKYAKQHKDSYSAVFWVNIKDEDSLKQSFARIARQILREHPSASQLNNLDIKGDLDEVVDSVKAWLSLPYNTRWLMIYDNYDNPKLNSTIDPIAVDIRRFLPESYQGSIIISTRSSQVKIGHRIPITKLKNLSDSLAILSNTSNRQGITQDLDAIRLAEKLDGFPLALATAGACLDQVAMSFSDYLRLYEESWAKLQQTSPELSSYEYRTLYSTWQVSFDHVKQRNSLSAKLLCLWAYFDNQDLWFELLRHGNSEDPDWIRELTEDELSFHSTMRVLIDHGLVEADRSLQELNESRGYSIHGCVHSWIIHVLNQNWDCDLANLAVTFVGMHVPGGKAVRPWLTQQRLLQHAVRCSYMVLNDLVAEGYIEDACNRLGNLYMDQGKLDEAENMFRRALQGYEKTLGAEHISTLNAVHYLGVLFRKEGKLEEAEKMFQRALQGKEKALGAEHTSTLDTVNSLGILYVGQGKLEAAEKMFQRALQGFEKALGTEHTSMLDIVNNLGSLYKDQGKLEEAEKMFQRALQGFEKALGTEHIVTLSTVNNLGILYKDQGKLDEAEKMYQRALQGKEKALGTEHTSTLDIVNNLGNIYMDQGKLDEAENMFQRALQGFEKALGTEHIVTLSTVNNLGILYKDQGKLEEAEKMYQRALQGYKKALGTEHTLTLSTINNLGSLYAGQGKLDEAKRIYKQALQGYEKAVGHELVKTYVPALNTVENLAVLYAKIGQAEEARDMYSRALYGLEIVLGRSSKRCQRIIAALAALNGDRR